jgi:hypothetical protein
MNAFLPHLLHPGEQKPNPYDKRKKHEGEQGPDELRRVRGHGELPCIDGPKATLAASA